jgi:hypothetical protein
LITSICWNRNGSQVSTSPVLRRAALDDVRDVDVIPLQIDRFDDLGQKLPGPPDKWNPLQVFVGAWRFADEHQIGIRVADAEHDLLPAERMKLAARAVRPYLQLDDRQGVGRRTK